MTVTAGASNVNYYDELGTYLSDASQYINSVLSNVSNLNIGAVTGISAEVVVQESDASIDLDGTTIVGSGAVTIDSTATSDASLQTVPVTGDEYTGAIPFTISVGYGQASSSAITTVTDSSITGAWGGRGHVLGDEHRERFESGVRRHRSHRGHLHGDRQYQRDLDRHDLAGILRHVHGVSGPDQCGGERDQLPDRRIAERPVFRDVLRGGRRLRQCHDQYRGGRHRLRRAQRTRRHVQRQPEAASEVNYQKSTITVANNGLADGTAVTYSDGGATSIGGLINGNTYYVQVLNANTFQLANGPTIPLSYTPPSTPVASTQTLGKVSMATFTSSDVDTCQNTITITPAASAPRPRPATS